jgi:4-carboxymuconolactone decarboxylase
VTNSDANGGVESSRFETGLRVRREVLGDEYVDRALAASTGFSEPLQELLTEFCWGAIWARDGLDRRTRSLINIAMLTALNRPEELKAHIGGALRNGCTEEEIVEVLLQTAVYCGMPAGVDAFRAAAATLRNGATSSPSLSASLTASPDEQQ